MNASWADWIAVGLAVVVAATWLALRIWRNWRKQVDARNRACACSSGCDGCPFSKGCGSHGD